MIRDGSGLFMSYIENTISCVVLFILMFAAKMKKKTTKSQMIKPTIRF